MLPKWSLGYIQSKEKYNSQEELVNTVRKYRELEIPLDCIVQDWHTWEEGLWGDKNLDQVRYPNMLAANKEIHDMKVHTMVSIWPNMNTGGKNHNELFKKHFLLNDHSTYNAFNEEARLVYWKQMEDGLYSQGFDSWWCDCTEPFSAPDWSGEFKKEPWERYYIVSEEHKKYIDAGKSNLFALLHAKGIYENQRLNYPGTRVLNLTRSGYAGSQKYGVILWSGDISASWQVLRQQITEGLNCSMSGIPYWTLDIGGFFTVKDAWHNRGCGQEDNTEVLWFWKGDYNQGVEDLAYRELYVRWLQFATFLPIFRSHGTDTPREIWNFGEAGTIFYDVIKKYILLRYQLMPYFYSHMWKVTKDDYTILRSFLFDYSHDPKAISLSHEFMCGESLLICPVTQAMYYEVNSEVINRKKEWTTYLPAGNSWFDFGVGKNIQGVRK
jgi:alpha-D-xyloside xylohydrolase